MPVAVVAAGVNSVVVESVSTDAVEPVVVHTPPESRAVGDPARFKSDPAGVNLVVVVAVLSTDAGDPVAVLTPPEPRVDGDPVRSAVGDPMVGAAAKSLKGLLSTLGQAMPSFGDSVQRHFSINSRASMIIPLIVPHNVLRVRDIFHSKE